MVKQNGFMIQIHPMHIFGRHQRNSQLGNQWSGIRYLHWAIESYIWVRVRVCFFFFFFFSSTPFALETNSCCCCCAQTSFKIPPGTSPVVVDLQGMGKGHAWVNGNSLGRYWPSQIADTNGCSDTCDYRGEYKPEKCVTNCGNPSQRWYNFNHFLQQSKW